MMSVFPEFLVLGSDGTIGAYAREDIMRIALAENFRAGAPARGVFQLDPTALNVIYSPTDEYAQWTEPLENLCPRHTKMALPAPTRSTCIKCDAEADSRRFKALNQGVSP